MSCLLVMLALAAAPATIDTAVVCPEPLRPAMLTWIDYRTEQGHGVAWVSAAGTAGEIRDRLRQLADQHPLKYVILVGDAPSLGAEPQPANSVVVPTHYIESKVTVKYGSEPHLASDAPYGDLDGDGVPERAVGRLPVDTPQELSALIARTIAYEQAGDGGAWQRKINFVAGLSGMGAFIDTALESLTRSILADNIPAAYATSMTYASWHSPYCPDPSRFRETTLERLNDGCLFWVYIGHGQPYGVDEVQVPDGPFPILTSSDAGRLRAPATAPIALFLACYTGAFDAGRDCLAEDMLKAPGGPIAVVSGSRVTMPYGMSVLGLGMLDACFVDHAATLGDAILLAKRKALTGPRDDARSQLLDTTATILNPAATDLAAERREHAQLFNLLGDPLLRLRHPESAQIEVSPQTIAGATLDIRGLSPIDGEAEIELVVRRDRLTFAPVARASYDSSEAARSEYQAVYQRANDTRLAVVHAPVVNGEFRARLEVPREAGGACHIRVFVQSDDRCALGAVDVRVEPLQRTADRRSTTTK